MSFTTPWALLALATLPYFVWLAWGGRDGRSRLGLGVRLALATLIVLALAGTQRVRLSDDLAVVFVVDASDSISPTQAAQAEASVRQALAAMTPRDRAAVVVFGGNALVERPLSSLTELAAFTSQPQTLHTDLAEAIRLGLALFPAGSARRLVILSDGVATTGETLEAGQLAAAAGAPLDYVLLARETPPAEAWLTQVDAPARVSQGERFSVGVTVESTTDQAGVLRLLADGRVLAEEQVRLRLGVNNFSLPLQAVAPAFTRYQITLEAAQDSYPQNNQLAAFTEIMGPPRVLVVASDGEVDEAGNPLPDEAPAVTLALAAVGLETTRLTPTDLPADGATLSDYAAVVLVNVNAKHLTPRQMAGLEQYVRDLGGGLVAVGGPQSYGMGGYFQTPLEAALPVAMQIQDSERFPAVALALVIDRSGSMAASEGGVTKIQLAAEGAARVVQLLNPNDVITIIPVDEQPDQVVGPLPAAEQATLLSQIRALGAGGGGIFVRTGLLAAAEALQDSPNEVRHIILLADGADAEQKEGVPELITSLTAEGITISTVAIGDGPDVPWLQAMAELGQGRFHFTDRAANLPQIFTQETTSVQRSYPIEERFFPELVAPSPILNGITLVPPLYGYVGTSAKATAQLVLRTHQGDPLLAQWQYGLGRAVAWTSDASGRWAREWVTWDGFASFWAQAVRWTITQGRDASVESVVTWEGEEARLTVEARGPAGEVLNDLALEANVVAPGGAAVLLPLVPVAPGRYAAAFQPTEEGAYLIRVAGAPAGDEETTTSVAQTTGWALGYSPEYQHLTAQPETLQALAALTGGQDRSADITTAFSHDLPPARGVRPIWQPLALAATLLLPLDIALRRLALGKQDWLRARRWLVHRRAGTTPAARPERPAPVARLFEAKQRATERRPPLTPPADQVPPPAGPKPDPDALPAGDRAATSDPEALAARLLARKRQSRHTPPEEKQI